MIDTIRAFIRDLRRLEQLKRDAYELHRIRRLAKKQSRVMDDIAHDGRNARSPNGDDWNELAAQCGAFEEH